MFVASYISVASECSHPFSIHSLMPMSLRSQGMHRWISTRRNTSTAACEISLRGKLRQTGVFTSALNIFSSLSLSTNTFLVISRLVLVLVLVPVLNVYIIMEVSSPSEVAISNKARSYRLQEAHHAAHSSRVAIGHAEQIRPRTNTEWQRVGGMMRIEPL
jgi:hypothetical protein